MAVTPAGSTGAMAFRSVLSCALAAAEFSSERASCVTAQSVIQYFRSPKCLLAMLAFLTVETSCASSTRPCEVRANCRISRVDEDARMTSSATERKISRARIETFGIKLVPPLVDCLLWLRDEWVESVCHL